MHVRAGRTGKIKLVVAVPSGATTMVRLHRRLSLQTPSASSVLLMSHVAPTGCGSLRVTADTGDGGVAPKCNINMDPMGSATVSEGGEER